MLKQVTLIKIRPSHRQKDKKVEERLDERRGVSGVDGGGVRNGNKGEGRWGEMDIGGEERGIRDDYRGQK